MREGIRGWRVTEMVLVVAALHGFVLSVVLGPRCVAYLAAAYLCAVTVWGTVGMSGQRGRAGFVVGLGVSVAVQQASYQAWRAELAGFWWPVAQFFAVQWVIGLGTQRLIRHVLGAGVAEEHEQANNVVVADRREPRWTCL